MMYLRQFLTVSAALLLFYSGAVGWSPGTALSCLLTAATLVLASHSIHAAVRSERIAILAWLYWGLSFVSNLIEALYFHVLPMQDALHSLFAGLALALLVACLLQSLMPAIKLRSLRPHSSHAPGTFPVALAPRLWWRIPLLAVLFCVFYLAAGAAIFPWVASFYRNRPLPSLSHLLVLQLFRGLLDIACILPLFHRWNQSRLRAAVLSACIFTILCGWGPLLLPNRFMPGPIRLAHGIEMGAFGIVFGGVAALLLLKSQRPTVASATAAVADRQASPAPEAAS